MLFEKEKYYKYINTIEKAITITYILIVGFFCLLGAASKNILIFTAATMLGFGIAHMYTLNAKIRIQRMRLEIDIHENICRNKKE